VYRHVGLGSALATGAMPTSANAAALVSTIGNRNMPGW
jgi:hypothetical protein